MNMHRRLALLVLLVLLAMSWAGYLPGQATATHTVSVPGDWQTFPPLPAHPEGPGVLAYPADPTADIGWSAGYDGVADIQVAFNYARATENSQLGTSLPMLTLPSQAEWDALSNGERALWLINRERVDRNVLPLHGVETNVTGVAQYYASYLLDNDAWGHYADGQSPWERLSANPAIGACHDALSVAENIAVFVTTGSNIPLPVERSVYLWMYDDGSCCSWGHRHAILWYPYDDNSGSAGREGFLGIGRATGGPYQGPFSEPWPLAELIVMNVFDPCATWDYTPGSYENYLPLLYHGATPPELGGRKQ